jgi:hypothetical protein
MKKEKAMETETSNPLRAYEIQKQYCKNQNASSMQAIKPKSLKFSNQIS